MCIAFILWHCHPRYQILIALNRDELYSRPTLAAHWWSEYPNILAGKDLSQGGTWFGCTKNGRFALLTSFREPEQRTSDVVSRGHLTSIYLQSSKDPLEYAQEVFASRERYNGFNLLVGDLRSQRMTYVSNRPNSGPIPAHEVSPGFHVLCNESLNSPWPKVLRGRGKIEQMVQELGPLEIPKERIVEEVLKDSTKADEATLPKTGYPIEWEYQLSPIYVDCETIGKGGYGSRSMSIFSVSQDGEAKFFERFLEESSWKEHSFCFEIEELKQNIH